MSKEEIILMLKENKGVVDKVIESLIDNIDKAANLITNVLKDNKTVFLAGNGGSASMASHIAGEFVGRFKKERRALPSIALTTDMASITSISNDYDFSKIFSRQLEALGKKDDLFIALSTSGNSANLIEALSAAKKSGMKTISLLGRDGGKMKGMADIELIVPSDNTPRIQELHLVMLHIIAELAESYIQKTLLKGLFG